MYGTQNKQMQVGAKINEVFPGNPWSFTGEFNGRKWQFLVMYSNEKTKPTAEQEQKLKEIVESIEPNAPIYVLPYSD